MAYTPKDTKERISHRLKITKGHMEKILSMVNEDAYCIDILHQSQAVRKALEQIDHLVLENHLTTCASDAIKKGKGEEAVREIMEVIKRKNS